ncbi:ParB/RepB/Spo0J family partition protein [Desulfatitalea alkaliphila]|uniref:ParB N-terminal domain-containing protein n=1 Tax=Desulfatitalea alkaliphila TaxID=2929485 RepID=A0AA41R557_9BACT|nr:ParB N-terminal domain-containing protein [Desulfatitalea alkaliphila]MCJ8501996.1 ParB N-terminal domain-containing protein [Desulfatitalea alkaliphila]
MDFEIRSVPPALIDAADETFRISSGQADDALTRSIQSVGLLHPPVLLAKGERWVVVCGFARVEVCRRLAWREMPARCLPAESAFADCALMAVADNSSQRSLDIVETAKALKLLEHAAGVECAPDGGARLLKSAGIEAGPQLLKKLRPVPRMAPWLQGCLAKGTIPLPMALRLHDLDDAAAARILGDLFENLVLSLGRQRDLLDWVQAIAMREGMLLAQVLADPQLVQWRQDAEMDRGRKSQLIRDHIRRRRFPAITAFETRYAQTVKALQPANGLQLLPPAHFEGRTYRLQIDFQSADQLRELAREVERLAAAPPLRRLLEDLSVDQSPS